MSFCFGCTDFSLLLAFLVTVSLFTSKFNIPVENSQCFVLHYRPSIALVCVCVCVCVCISRCVQLRYSAVVHMDSVAILDMFVLVMPCV